MPTRAQTRPRIGGKGAMSLAVLPLAITMNAGPQIMSALIFVTASKPLRLSAYFLTGVVIAVTVGVTVTFGLASAFGNSISLGDSCVTIILRRIYLVPGSRVSARVPRNTGIRCPSRRPSGRNPGTRQRRAAARGQRALLVKERS